ncbi:hypothetical protein ACFQBQ_05120 [Granulicella cerasi]|uniref:Uncharacterized protein n=1 Tax=Granulicella cerasi TaxID=741063 RepID=A0ABW1Z6B0_9BACT|nr:hypothetical protein [Granulicella cerasi]
MSAFTLALTLSSASLCAQQPAPPAEKPLPSVDELLKAVEKHEARDESLLQLYTYHIHRVEEDFDGSEAVKKTEITDYESIPIDGVRVRKLVGKNGHPLSPQDATKANDEFDKAVEKAKSQQAKNEARKQDDLISAARMLQLGDFTHERRVDLNGRPTIALDFAGKKAVKANGMSEKIMQDLYGTVWIDEEDRVLARVEGHFRDDFKLGFGLLADIHKGLNFTMEQQKVNGEVWLPKSYGGQGKASLGWLVFRIHGRARATISDYRKYRTSSRIVSVDDQPTDTPPQP